MKHLSIGSFFALQIAATEAAEGKFQFIEKEHVLIGILSLGKLLMLNPEKFALKLQDRQALQAENDFIEDILREFEIDSTQLRRQLRKKLGDGNYERTEKIVHRSEACKKVFKRTEELAASSKEISCLHLLAAIMEALQGIISQVVNETAAETSRFARTCSRLL